MTLQTDSVAIPAPWSWAPSSYWDGNDGYWNTFIVQVGTPPQTFRVLPSTDGQETWILNPEGCTSADAADCPSRRGAFNSIGYEVNASSTWRAEGIYELDGQEQQLGYYGNGLYGFDTVKLGNGSSSLQLTAQVVAGIADKSFFLGEFGIGPKSVNFTTFADPIPNYMSNLVSSGLIPSLSYGYTAGAYYRSKAPASLTLGGYDTSRMATSNLTIPMSQDNSRPLQVCLRKILGTNTLLGGASNLLPATTYHYLDSAIPHIWLPADAVAAFVSAFGLTYDPTTDLYLINDTMRSLHLQNQPVVTFVLAEGSDQDTGITQNIVLPYAAFDLQVSSPFYNKTTNYFPIRLAHNDTQYSIGRVFFQEAYVVADWQRQNFSVTQTTFDNLGSPSIVPILSIQEDTVLNQTAAGTDNRGLPAGGIAGIVIGATALLFAVAALLLLRCRRRALAAVASPETKKVIVMESEVPEEAHWDALRWKWSRAHEISGGTAIHELGHDDGWSPSGWKRDQAHEVSSNPAVHELDHGDIPELESDPVSGGHELSEDVNGAAVHSPAANVHTLNEGHSNRDLQAPIRHELEADATSVA